ncbi:hypothetical protein [Clavibacter tessellarius]|uniref:hypothetical protein n=1 Tax=Clavibacter tessellarius TaxID=31965 RepID=UPI0039EB5FB7
MRFAQYGGAVAAGGLLTLTSMGPLIGVPEADTAAVVDTYEASTAPAERRAEQEERVEEAQDAAGDDAPSLRDDLPQPHDVDMRGTTSTIIDARVSEDGTAPAESSTDHPDADSNSDSDSGHASGADHASEDAIESGTEASPPPVEAETAPSSALEVERSVSVDDGTAAASDGDRVTDAEPVDQGPVTSDQAGSEDVEVSPRTDSPTGETSADQPAAGDVEAPPRIDSESADMETGPDPDPDPDTADPEPEW